MDPKPLSKDVPTPLDPLAARASAPDSTPKEMASMIELGRRVRAATHEAKALIVDVWTGKKKCHRFFHFIDTDVPDKINPRLVGVQSNLISVGCLGAQCALWDDENKRCLDVSEKLAAVKTADTLEVIDGLMRMLQDGK